MTLMTRPDTTFHIRPRVKIVSASVISVITQQIREKVSAR